MLNVFGKLKSLLCPNCGRNVEDLSVTQEYRAKPKMMLSKFNSYSPSYRVRRAGNRLIASDGKKTRQIDNNLLMEMHKVVEEKGAVKIATCGVSRTQIAHITTAVNKASNGYSYVVRVPSGGSPLVKYEVLFVGDKYGEE